MKYIDGIKYVTTEDEWFETTIYINQDIITPFIELYTNGRMLVKANYAWDGASGPTFDTPNTMTPSLGHDALAQLMRIGLLPQHWRKQTNNDFHRWLRERGMWKIRAWAWKRGLDRFGGPSTLPKNKRKVFEVE